MIIVVPNVLNASQLGQARAHLDLATWVDGKVSAGHQGLRVKDNRQIAEDDPLAAALGDLILASLERNALFISAALPNRVYPPMFNRYDTGMTFGNHVDNAVRMLPGTSLKFRTDLSATLFLNSPDEYDGGELLIEDAYGPQSIKLAAGDLLLYPSSSVHRVAPVTRGLRLASFFWCQSLIRDDGRRQLLFDLDRAIQRLGATNADEGARLQLTGCYHNLLRMWSEP